MPLAALSSFCAPTTRVWPSPLMAMRTPNQSNPLGFEDFRKASSVQVFPLRAQTYAAPAEETVGASAPGSTTRLFSHPAGLTPGVRQFSSALPPAMVLPSSLMATE